MAITMKCLVLYVSLPDSVTSRHTASIRGHTDYKQTGKYINQFLGWGYKPVVQCLASNGKILGLIPSNTHTPHLPIIQGIKHCQVKELSTGSLVYSDLFPARHPGGGQVNAPMNTNFSGTAHKGAETISTSHLYTVWGQRRKCQIQSAFGQNSQLNGK